MKRLIRNKQEVKQMFFKTSTFIALGIVICLFSGCATMPRNCMKEITSGKLVTPGCKIESITGDFVINSGEVFTPPFQTPNFYYSRSYASQQFVDEILDPDYIKDIGHQRYLPTNPEYTSVGAVIKKYDQALKYGARKVLVTAPGLSEPLYGVLFLGSVHKKSSGAAANSYQIQIPQSYINQTLNGKLSVIHETVDFEFQDLGYGSFSSHGIKSSAFLWVLWLSKMPFPEDEQCTDQGKWSDFGFKFNCQKDGAQVIGIIDESLADFEYLHVGDKIIEVGKESVAGWSNQKFNEKLYDTYKIKIIRQTSKGKITRSIHFGT